ncbi:hypothetical protein GCM10023196_092870 [Actinoallomurus vinaceus]|uniref:CU044_5270 family protein n=1 Tax=Actinoallomurus vinaceus TaxID=1080074 RepID=A0ABP8URJ2_9ACTN
MRTEDDLRAALTTLERHTPDADTVLRAVRSAGGRRRGRRPALRWWASGLTTAGALAAAAAVFAMSATPAGPPPSVFRMPDGTEGTANSDVGAARQVLLAAAKTAARSPLTTGRHWKKSTITGNFVQVGPSDDRYLIMDQSRNESWTARSSDDVMVFTQSLGAQLASTRDRAAWRRDGSPTAWASAGASGLAGPQGFTEGGNRVTTAPGERHMAFGEKGPGGRPFSVGGHSMSLKELQALPADPARLEKLFLDSPLYKHREDGDAASYLIEQVPEVLAMPVTRQVRSALYRMLAGVSGVRSLGRVRDVAGHEGVAIAVTEAHQKCGDRTKADTDADPSWIYSTCTVEQRLVINPATGLPVAQELRYTKLPAGPKWSAPGGLFSYEIFEYAGWTNASAPGSQG